MVGARGKDGFGAVFWTPRRLSLGAMPAQTGRRTGGARGGEGRASREGSAPTRLRQGREERSSAAKPKVVRPGSERSRSPTLGTKSTASVGQPVDGLWVGLGIGHAGLRQTHDAPPSNVPAARDGFCDVWDHGPPQMRRPGGL